jgi:hypothetical protein
MEKENHYERFVYPKKLKGFVDWLKRNQIRGRMMFFILGITSTVWFLIRVVPKPQRAAYPCMRIAAPLMSSFVLWLIAVTTSVFAFRRVGKNIRVQRYLAAGFFFFIAAVFALVSLFSYSDNSFASILIEQEYVPNQPVGMATGINPGRVVWIWDPDATNEDMRNESSDYWYQNGNADQVVIDTMLDKGIRDLAGVNNTFVAWDSLFTWFNRKHNNGNKAYQSGEKIAIKLNITNSCCNVVNYSKAKDKERMDNTPELVFSLLKQLIEVYGVNQEDIYIGDPYRSFTNMYWNLCHTKFPDVHYMDGNGTDGREQTRPSEEQVLVFSDKKFVSSLPQHYLDATYLINLPALKSHNATGFTLAAKNHQGSIIELDTDPSKQTAGFMHYSMAYQNHSMRQYRHLVDYMGHKDMGGKTFLYLVDGIWGGYDWQGYIYKWDMLPFDGDYPSSIFLSQDAVAIESVIFDFMLEEYKNPKNDGREQYPYIFGVDDYLLQAADNSFWPNYLHYDPEGDETPIGSLGVYEHWNNPVDKQYSRNLGTGDGIELVKVFMDDVTRVIDPPMAVQLNLYPNPVTDWMSIEIVNNWNGLVSFRLLDINGRLLITDNLMKVNDELKLQMNLINLNSGNYILVVSFDGNYLKRKVQKI